MPKMATKKQPEKKSATTAAQRTNTIRLIEKYIAENFKIEQFERVVITELWERRYRVNVWQYSPNQVNHSFFIIVKDNQVTYCNPPIKNSAATDA